MVATLRFRVDPVGRVDIVHEQPIVLVQRLGLDDGLGWDRHWSQALPGCLLDPLESGMCLVDGAAAETLANADPKCEPA